MNKRLVIHNTPLDVTSCRGAPELLVAVIAFAHEVARARKKIDPKTGAAANSVWDAIERAENSMLRAVEKLSGLKRGALGTRDSA